MNNQENAYLSDSDILRDLDVENRELGLELLSYRQSPSPALLKRVMAIPQPTVPSNAPAKLRYRPQRAFAWAAISLIVVIAVLLSFPRVQASAAELLMGLQEDITGLLSGNGPSSLRLSPTPIFTVRQPDYLPEGFVRTAVHYRSHLQILVREQLAQSSSNAALLLRMESYDVDVPYLLISYEADDSNYMLLFERQAAQGEELPVGSSQNIDGYAATLRAEDGIVILTWIADDTWLTLESNIDEASLIAVAQSLLVTQRPGNSIVGGSDIALCNPDHEISRRLLGRVPDQHYWGSIWIDMFDREVFPDSIAYGISTAGVTEDMLFQRGLDALRDPRLVGETLSTPPVNVFETSADGQCLEPDSDLLGYIVLEIWDEQVNAAFVGQGAALRERAIDALEAEIAR
jgi:hypothetical protein